MNLIKSFAKLSLLKKIIIALVVIGIVITAVVVPVMLTQGSDNKTVASALIATSTTQPTPTQPVIKIPSTTLATDTTVSMTIAPTVPPTQAAVLKTQLGIAVPVLPSNVCWKRDDGLVVSDQNHIFTLYTPSFYSKADSSYSGKLTGANNQWKWDYTGSNTYIILDESFLDKSYYTADELAKLQKNVNGRTVYVADKTYRTRTTNVFWQLSNC